jgi:hypothetical protein
VRKDDLLCRKERDGIVSPMRHPDVRTLAPDVFEETKLKQVSAGRADEQ